MKPASAPYIYIDCGIADNSLMAANREVAAALQEGRRRLRVPRVPWAHTLAARDYWDRLRS
jgi:hypothetical protein